LALLLQVHMHRVQPEEQPLGLPLEQPGTRMQTASHTAAAAVRDSTANADAAA
jgi:hypothetical protein